MFSGGGSGGGGGIGGGHSISWNDPLLSESSIFVFIEKAFPMDRPTDSHERKSVSVGAGVIAVTAASGGDAEMAVEIVAKTRYDIQRQLVLSARPRQKYITPNLFLCEPHSLAAVIATVMALVAVVVVVVEVAGVLAVGISVIGSV